MNATTDSVMPADVLGGIAPATGITAALTTSSAVDAWNRRALAGLLAVAVIAAAVVALIVRSPDLDAELGGGDSYAVPAALSRDDVFDALDAAGIGRGAEVVVGRSIPGERQAVTVRLGHEHREAADAVRAALATAAGVEVDQVTAAHAGRAWSNDSDRQVVLISSIAALVAAFVVMFTLGWRAALAALFAAATAAGLVAIVVSVLGVTVGQNHLLVAAAVAVLGFFVSTLVTGQVRANRTRFREAGLGSEDLYNVSANQALPATIAAVGVPALVAVATVVVGLVNGAGGIAGLALLALVGMVGAWCAGVFGTVAAVAALGDRRAALDGVDHGFSGARLRSAVAGGASTLTSLTGRKRAVERAASGTERVVQRTVSPTATTEQILSHPARPRKKKRH